MNKDWDLFFMKMVYLIANKSKDTSTKIGAIIVNDNNQIIKIGYNGFPIGIDDSVEERFQRPLKYAYTAHAEANAIFFAARDGAKIEGCKLYTNALCCNECAKAVIQSGISEVIYHTPYYAAWKLQQSTQWSGHENITHTLFKEGNVVVRELNIQVNFMCLVNGNLLNF